MTNDSKACVRDLYWECENTFHATNTLNPNRPLSAYPLNPLLHSGNTGVRLTLLNLQVPYYAAHRTIGDTGIRLLLECLHKQCAGIDLTGDGQYRERIGISVDTFDSGCTLYFIGGTSNNTGNIHLNRDETERFTGWLENMRDGFYRDHNGYIPEFPRKEATCDQ